MKSWLRLTSALASCLVISGCYTLRYSVDDSPGPVEVTHDKGYFRQHFKVEGRAYYILYGLVPVYQPTTADLLKDYTTRGRKIVNLRMSQEWGPWDILLTVGVDAVVESLSLGINPGWSILGAIGPYSRTVTYEGDVQDNNNKEAQ